MPLVDRLSALNGRFDTLDAAAAGLPAGARSDIATARSRFAVMTTQTPGRLTDFYDNFTQNVGTIKRSVKSIGTLTDNPTGLVCGVVSLAATGAFLSDLEDAVDFVIAGIGGTLEETLARISKMLSDLDKTIGISDALQDIKAYLAAAEDALRDWAETVGIAALADAYKTLNCLTHAAEFTIRQSTLAAKQIQDLNLDPRGAGLLSLNRTGIKNTTTGLTDSLKARLNLFG